VHNLLDVYEVAKNAEDVVANPKYIHRMSNSNEFPTMCDLL
jgi:hypothetical protein